MYQDGKQLKKKGTDYEAEDNVLKGLDPGWQHMYKKQGSLA
jgi:hypothetical protein